MSQSPRDGGPSFRQLVNDACEHLPDGWTIALECENGCGMVKLIDPDGEEVDQCFDDMTIDQEFAEALAKAIELNKGWPSDY